MALARIWTDELDATLSDEYNGGGGSGSPTITYSGGECRLFTNGTAPLWNAGASAGLVVYKPLADLPPAELAGLYRVDTRRDSFTVFDVFTAALSQTVLWKDFSNAYVIEHDLNNNTIHVDRIVAGISTRLFSGGSVAGQMFFRIYANTGVLTHSTQDGDTLAAGRVSIYSKTSTGSWIKRAEEVLAFAGPYRMGFGQEDNGNAGFGAFARCHWEYFYIDFESDDVAPPTITNKNPAPASSDVPRNSNINFSFEDDVSVDLTTVKVYVKGLLAYDGATDTFQPGWNGPGSSYAANGSNGYDFVIDPSADLNGGEVVTVRGVADDTNSNTVDETWSFQVAYSATDIDNVFVIAKKVIRVTWQGGVSVTANHNDPTSYSISSLDGSETPRVLRVLPVEGSSSRYTFLEVAALQYGKRYSLTIPAGTLRDDSGSFIDAQKSSWTMHRTKVDGLISTLPSQYDKRIGSNIRSIIEAFGIVDEEIGGDF